MYDCQPACLSGIQKEFISSGRLDNLATSIPLTYAIINASKNLEEQTSINFMALFDNEEVGSMSYQGANCSFISKTLQRLFNTIQTSETFEGNY